MPTTAQGLGEEFAARLQTARHELQLSLRGGARDLSEVVGLQPNGTATVPIENTYAAATEILAASGSVFLWGENVVLEIGPQEARRLHHLTMGHESTPSAPPLIANFLTCTTGAGTKSPVFLAPPRNFVSNLLARGPTRDALPRIRICSRRPVFDNNFILCGPGFHAESGILVHGLEVEPVPLNVVDANMPIRDRLPPHIRTLFSGYCLWQPADVANALAVLLTGVLSNHFVAHPKPLGLIDANQPGVGKTLLAITFGNVLDGEAPDLIHFATNDEELAKRTLATLRQRATSILLYDNAKRTGGLEVSSPFLEANSMAPNVTLRILGKSTNFSRPNDLLWFLTMNQTRVSPDLASRGIPIRFYYEGDPARRVFDTPNPFDFSLEYRREILGELYGMVDYWNAQGRPPGGRSHRCAEWARIIGGILQTCGFSEFLENLDDAAGDFNSSLNDLAALAECVARSHQNAACLVTNELNRSDHNE